MDTAPALTGCADVLVDRTPAHLGALSYRIPAGLTVHVGDAVAVPFGTRDGHGIVLGAGNPTKATRELTATFGARAHPADIDAARRLAAWHCCPVAAVARRLAPRTAKGAAPLDAGPAQLIDPDRASIPVQRRPGTNRLYLLTVPTVDTARLAAETALKLHRHTGGAVLVLAPTVAAVDGIVAQYSSGAARLDAAADRGAWRGFQEGTVPIGVGTRAAALYSPARLAGIVVVDTDHPGHIEATHPHTNAVDVAALRTRLRCVPYIAIGAAPSAANLGGGVKLAVAGDVWPTVTIVDRSTRAPGQRAFPPPVTAAIARARRRGDQPVVVAPTTTVRRRCTRCGTDRSCPTCPPAATCTHLESPCARCGETTTRLAGWDAARIEDALAGQVRAVTAAELAGVRDAGLVVVMDADAPGNGPTLEPEAATLRLLAAAAAAAGPGGTVIAVTAHPDDPLLNALAGDGGHVAAVRAIWDAARRNGLPPFGWLVQLRIARRRPPDLSDWPGRVAGPRQTTTGEWDALVRVDDVVRLRPHLDRLRRSAKVRITVTPGACSRP